MAQESDDLEQQCEDMVFQICCTRERYSVRCANQLEKCLDLRTKINTASVQKSTVPDFKTPDSSEEQQKLFDKFTKSKKGEVQKTNSKSDVRSMSKRLKELKSIIGQIERHRQMEISKLLGED